MKNRTFGGGRFPLVEDHNGRIEIGVRWRFFAWIETAVSRLNFSTILAENGRFLSTSCNIWTKVALFANLAQ